MLDVTVGIIGCGRMGRERARCATSLGAKISAVFDPDTERSRYMHEQYGATLAETAGDCLDRPLDAVFLCVPPGQRGAVAIECADRNLALLTEKPVALSAQDALQALESFENAGVINAVGYMNRYRASVRAVREKLREIRVIGFSAHWICKPYAVPWWMVAELSGGPHNEQATHLFDLSRFLFGEVASVSSQAASECRVSTLLQFESGVLGTIFYSCEGSGKDIGMRIFTEQGTLALTRWDFKLTENTIDASTPSAIDEDIFLKETAAFLGAVAERKPELILSDLRDAVRTQAVMDASRKSLQTSTEVYAGDACRIFAHA